MKALIAKLVLPLYVVAIGFLSWAGIQSYLNASAILSDHTVVKAPIELMDVSERTKRGHTTTTYEFEYTYVVDGKEYVSEYSAVNEKGEKYVGEPIIEVAYANGDPVRSGALHVLARQAKLGSLIIRLLIVSVILGVVAMFVYGWAIPDDEDDEVATEPVSA